MLVAAIENNEELTHSIKEKTNNFEGYITPEGSNEVMSIVDMFTSDTLILNRAFGHALNLKSVSIIEYIIEGAETYFMNP